MREIVFIVVLTLLGSSVLAQNSEAKNDSIPLPALTPAQLANDSLILAKKAELAIPKKKKRKHSPLLATSLAVVLPGAGQFYNRKYWKIPIVWGGIGGLGYYLINSNTSYQSYRKSYLKWVNDDASKTDASKTSTLKNYRDAFQKQRENAIIYFSIFYALQAVDAFVDAHLQGFDVSDDLGIDWSPTLKYEGLTNTLQPGLQFQVNLNKRTRKPGSIYLF